MNNKIQLKVEELNKLAPANIVENESVEKKFIQMYTSVHGKNGLSFYEKEKFNFRKLLQEKPELCNCTNLSLYGAFLDIAVNGLSLDSTGKPHCYLIPRSVKSGHKDNTGKDIYERRATVSVTAYGELVMRMRAGQIRYADNPVIVYECDVFKAELISGKKVVTYSASIPRKSNKIVGAFIRIVRNDGSTDFQWMLEGDINRLATYSQKNNSYYDKAKGCYVEGQANALYTSNQGQIDPGFLENKMIKHAFDAYPKVQTGNYTMLETQEEPGAIDYGIEEADYEDASEPRSIGGFGNEDAPQEQPQGVTIITSDEDDSAGF